jgi:hypothetical protein
MIHVVVMKCLIGLPLRFYEGVGVGVLKIEESEPESELLCTDSTALLVRIKVGRFFAQTETGQTQKSELRMKHEV